MLGAGIRMAPCLPHYARHIGDDVVQALAFSFDLRNKQGLLFLDLFSLTHNGGEHQRRKRDRAHESLQQE